mgnify:CR=1 FL=1
MTKKRPRLGFKKYLSALWQAVSMGFQTSPLAVSFKIFNAILTAIMPIVLTYFAALTTTALVAAFNGDKEAGGLALNYVVITVLLGLFQTVWGSIDGYIQGIMRYTIDAKMSDMMYERFLRLEFWRYDDKDTADTYDKAQQFAKFYAYVFDRFANLFSQVVSVVFSIIALYIFVPFVAVIVIVSLIPGIYVQFKLSRAQINHWEKNVDARRSQSFIEWNLLQPQAITELRLNNLVKHLLTLRRAFRDQDEKARLGFEKQFIGKQILSNTVETAAELVSLVWVTLQIIAGNQPVGQFIYVQQIVGRAISSANSFVQTLSSMDEDLAQMYDYQKFMAYPLGNVGAKKLDTAPDSIRLDDVSFSYFGSETEVLKHISMNLERGQHVAIVGENGAGKSTLIKLILGLYRPTAGQITIDGVALDEIDVDTWHRQLSVLQQDFREYLFASVRDNVYFGDVSSKFDRARYKAAMDKSESTDFVSKLPNKDSTVPSTWMEDGEGEKGVNLSGGQWQRIALARSFYRDTPIIILDEPTSAIDALAESRIFKHLLDDKNRTIVTISHRLTTVKKADVIYVLEDGKIVESGTHTELVKQGGTYVKIFEAQLDQPAEDA